MFAVCMVEVCHAFAGKFKMLLLILTYRYMRCSAETLANESPSALQFIPMDQYISCLQDGVRKKTQFELAADFLLINA